MTDATSTNAFGVDKATAEKTVDQVASDAKTAAASVQRRAGETVDQVASDAKTTAASVQQRVQDTADQLRRSATEQAGVAREWAQDQADVLRDTVQTRPFISIGVSAASAFAAGLVLGVLLTRR